MALKMISTNYPCSLNENAAENFVFREVFSTFSRLINVISSNFILKNDMQLIQFQKQ